MERKGKKEEEEEGREGPTVERDRQEVLYDLVRLELVERLHQRLAQLSSLVTALLSSSGRFAPFGDERVESFRDEHSVKGLVERVGQYEVFEDLVDQEAGLGQGEGEGREEANGA